ncbi:MAG TPA: hypothetical protein VEC12_09095 [Bacteroidia bacterium]|nr:hypothetical protein [Bacteroidia bacterium]
MKKPSKHGFLSELFFVYEKLTQLRQHRKFNFLLYICTRQNHPVMKNYWKPQHDVFIRGMLAHGDKIKAYLEAYPNISPAAARPAANRLLSYPHIRQRLEPLLQEAKNIAVEKLQQTAGERMADELLTVYEQRCFLAQIVRRELKLVRAITLRDRVVEVEQDLDPFIILRAIELDCKLEAGYQWPIREEVTDIQLSRLVSYLRSGNHQGAGVRQQPSDNPTAGEVNTDKGFGVRQQIGTDWPPNPSRASFSFFARPPFVTKKQA